MPPDYHRGFEYWAGFEHGHKYFDATYYTQTNVGIGTGAYEPDAQTDPAIEFIKRNAAAPWHLDLSKDPFEMTNLAGSVPHQQTGRRLTQLLVDWMRQTGDKDFAALRPAEQ